MNKAKSIGIGEIRLREHSVISDIGLPKKEISFKAQSGVYIEHFPFHVISPCDK